MKSTLESALNVAGLTRYIDDLPVAAGALHAVPVPAPCARARLRGIDPSEALALDP